MTRASDTARLLGAGGTLNGALSVDTITEKTSGNGVTIDSLNVKDGGIGGNQISGRRNIIINGDMRIAQRATSASSLSSGTSYDSIDMYKTQIVNAGTWTISQSTTAPTDQGFGYSLKMDCTAADTSLGADDFLVVQQVIEAQDLQYLKYGTSSAESITMSFWVRSNKTETFSIWLYADDNAKTISAPYTISSADTWEKKTITFAGDTASSITNDNGQGIRVYFVLAAGSNWTSGTTPTAWQSDSKAIRAPEQTANLADNTSNEWYVTGIQIEAGSQATPFEHRSLGEELKLCQRYYQIVGISFYDDVVSGRNYGANTGFPTQMRANPTVDSSSTLNNNNRFNSNALNAGIQVTTTSFLAHKTSISTSDAGYYIATANLKSEL